ncbi:hypothetical protein RB195_024581 [Necator americanus]|uniref:Uncharacterized protein n=1 Tax=Necator americanus TaxID=51031 RepID=A0ABR1ENR9_NECAM
MYKLNTRNVVYNKFMTVTKTIKLTTMTMSTLTTDTTQFICLEQMIDEVKAYSNDEIMEVWLEDISSDDDETSEKDENKFFVPSHAEKLGKARN